MRWARSNKQPAAARSSPECAARLPCSVRQSPALPAAGYGALQQQQVIAKAPPPHPAQRSAHSMR